MHRRPLGILALGLIFTAGAPAPAQEAATNDTPVIYPVGSEPQPAVQLERQVDPEAVARARRNGYMEGDYGLLLSLLAR